MIYLHTGLPGAGKTLFTLATVRDRAKAENRTVYYHGIEILKPEEFPGWVYLDDPAKWHTLPDGAIIVHDECQTLYRPRGTGSQVPEHVQAAETHRHRGHDLYLITQHPMLLDSNMRRLAGEHAHIVRPFGAKLATVHRWQSVKEQCDKNRADSIQTTFAYPAALFSAYKSATVHTHKFKLPGRVWLLPLIPVLLGLCVWGFWSWYVKRPDSVVPGVSQSDPVKALPGHQKHAPVQTRAEWFAERVPRVKGLEHTAPVFDKVTAATRAPYPAGCLQMGDRCKCYSDQGTVLETGRDICLQIVEKGYFLEFDPDRRREPRGVDRPDISPDRRDQQSPQASRYGFQAAAYAGGS